MTYIITFVAVFVTDYLYTNLVKAVQKTRPLQAGLWSTLVTLSASIAVINYTSDHWQLVPALLGAFCGTYFGTRYHKKTEIEDTN